MSSPNPNLSKLELKEIPDLALHLVEIELQKDPVKGLGIHILGGIDEPHIPGHPGIFISRINPEGPAAKDGRLRLGDRIAALNDISLTSKTHSDAVEIFRQASGKVKLLIEQDAETVYLSAPCSVFTTPVTDSPVQESLRLSILKSNSKICVSPTSAPIDTLVVKTPIETILVKTPSDTVVVKTTSDTAEKPEAKSEVIMTATVAAAPPPPIDVNVNPSFQLEKPIPEQPEAVAAIPSSDENGTNLTQRPRRQSFREPLVTLQPSEAAEQRKPPEQSNQNSSNLPTVVFPVRAVPVEEEEDRASTISVAPSVYSVIDDVPRTPKKPSSWFDPSSVVNVVSGLWNSLKNPFRR